MMRIFRVHNNTPFYSESKILLHSSNMQIFRSFSSNRAFVFVELNILLVRASATSVPIDVAHNTVNFLWREASDPRTNVSR